MEEIIKKLPLKCPSCECGLNVSKMRCSCCGTEVGGDFRLPALARLPEKDQAFMLNFVKASGSLKDMAKNMGISYPTVRNILDDIIEKLTNIENEP